MLHSNREIAQNAVESPYLAVFEDDMYPKNTLRPEAIPPEVAYRLIKDEMVDESGARQNLATFCQTYMEPEAERLMAEFMAVNAIDKSEYPQMTELENRCVHILAHLWSAEENRALGTSTVGSSEACMLSGMAMKARWKAQAEHTGLDLNRKPNLVISSAYQVCWEKFCVYWDVELRAVPVDAEHLGLDCDAVMDYVDDYTIGIVGILGITYTGKLDDIAALDRLVGQYNETAGIKISIHVDAASGGLFIPFTAPELAWDFRLPNVCSINTSGHKYGLVYPGIGWVLWKSKEYLPEQFIFYVNYLGGEEPTAALNFSRSGSQIIGQYYVFLRYGHNGLKLVHQHTLQIAQKIAEALKRCGLFRMYNDAADMPIVCYSLAEGRGWTLYDLADRLAVKGWQVPAYTLPDNLRDVVIQRVVVRADFSHALADAFLKDLGQAIEFLETSSQNGKGSTTYGFIH